MHSRRMLAAASCLLAMMASACGRHEGAGAIEGKTLPDEVSELRRVVAAEDAAGIAIRAGSKPPAKRVLFGDLHVHSTFSGDAFMWSLPITQGEGAKPVSDACDYARYCSGLDFFSMNDHAESLTPRRWSETVDSIRQCNAIAGDPANPDLVAYLGWEWTQIGLTADTHFGHKNVIVRDLEDDKIPARPINSAGFTASAMRTRIPWELLSIVASDWSNRQRYFNLFTFQRETVGTERCADGVNTRDLPTDCMEGAATPRDLFRKLDEWGLETMVIPHGTTWGIYTPRGSDWRKQLTREHHDPKRQKLIEVYSGHGNSETYMPHRGETYTDDGTAVCPEPQGAYEPCCWRAGEIIRSRCLDPKSTECERRVTDARRAFLDAGPVAGRTTIPGASLVEWRDCGSCPDCWLGSMNYRPLGSVQYIAALSSDDTGQDDGPMRFDFGFIASSDNHRARPGTGYKEVDRPLTTDANGPRSAELFNQLNATEARPAALEALHYDPETTDLAPWQITDFERQSTFFMTGGLVAVHSHGRSREDIWDALERREVYGTSGDRIMLWFDLLDAPGGAAPMGSRVAMNRVPRFRVRAVGSREQLAGCPAETTAGISEERLEKLCRGECYNPSDERRAITRIEVVRIRRQSYADEPVESLIEDPWKVLPCPEDAAGCVVEFEDEQFPNASRDALYYVRAIQEPTEAINAGHTRCRRDELGRCIEASPCYGDYRTAYDDDCLQETEERAWSSPIYISVSAE